MVAGTPMEPMWKVATTKVCDSLVWLLLRWQGPMRTTAEASQRADWEDLATTFRERGKQMGGGKHDFKHAWLGVGRASMDEEHSGKGRKMMSYNWETQSVCLDPGWLSGKESSSDAGDTTDSIPGSARSPGGEHGNPLQHSCLENPMDREAWRATVAQSLTQLKRLSNA